MLRRLNRLATSGRRIIGTPNVGILAATIASETATGDHGPGLLYDESLLAGNSGKQLRIRITSLPSAGNIFVYENGAFDFWDAPAGTYYVVYDWVADDVLGGSDTATIIVGATDGGAAGSTLTGTSTLTPGSASGTGAVNGSAPGATLTGASDVSAGGAQGAAAGAAPGATLTGTSAVSTGGASGEGNASVAGANLAGASTLAAGAPGASNAAPGTTLSGVGDITTGPATGNTALGAVLSGASSIIAGGAAGTGAAITTNRRRSKR